MGKTIIDLSSNITRSLLVLAIVILGSSQSFATGHLEYIEEFSEPTEAFDSHFHAKVAVVQQSPNTAPLDVTVAEAETVKARNRANLATAIKDAATQGAKWVVTSEMGVVGYPHIPGTASEDENFRTREEILPYAETIPGPSTEFFGDLAKKLKIHIQFGFAEIDPKTEKLYNAAVLVDPKGKVVLTHRKWSLFHVESNYLSRGTEANVYESPLGPVGMLICADVYNYSLLNTYKRKGAKVLNLSTSWAQMNTGMGYFRRAAQSSNAYLVAANQSYFPDSGIINRDGTNQSHIRQTRGLAFGYIPYVKPEIQQCNAIFK